MKLPLLANLNAIGLRGAADRALLAAHWLKIGTVSSPAVTITPEVPAIAAKAEVKAQTAKTAITVAIPARTGAQNTTGYLFGELYLNSPAYPAGTNIPLISPKPASDAVAFVPAVVAVPKVPAVTSPKIDAVKGWNDAITINKTASNIEIIAYLPYASSPLLVGSSTSGIGAINEITAPALMAGKWLGENSSAVLGTELNTPATVEKYLYKQALELIAESGSTSTIENSTKLVNGVVTPCKKLTLQLAATSYIPSSENIQLSKIGAIVVVGGLSQITGIGQLSTPIPTTSGMINTTIYNLVVAYVYEGSNVTNTLTPGELLPFPGSILFVEPA